MSKRSSEFLLPGPIGESRTACRQAAERLNWGIAEIEPARLLLKIGFGVVSNPAKIEVLFEESGDATRVILNGRIAQIGPIGSRKLENCLADLQRTASLSTRKPPPHPPR